MNSKLLYSATVLLCCLATPGEVWSQVVRPGLWELTQSFTGSPEMKNQIQSRVNAAQPKIDEMMSKLTPEQRQKMKDMMAKNGSGFDNGKEKTHQFCMSKEEAERGYSGPEKQEGCEQQMKRNGSTVTVHAVCGPDKNEIDAVSTVIDKEHFAVRGTSSGLVMGRVEKTSFESRGRWLAADCGKVSNKF